jgi:hypothetical protein
MVGLSVQQSADVGCLRVLEKTAGPRGEMLIRDPGLAESRDPGSLASQLDDSWRASRLARRASEAGCFKPASHPLSFSTLH